MGRGRDLSVAASDRPRAAPGWRRRALDRFLVALDRLVLGIFFREIEVVGRENVPASGPLLIVANHGNSLVDPMLVFGFVPRLSRFLAKSTLWRHPAAKYLVRLAAAIPVYRRKDPGVDPTRNAETFARSHEELAGGGVIALFPEGVSHSGPALMPLKTGVARIAFGAESRFGPLGLSILPVGLNFEDAEAFRSRVLIQIGTPLAVGPVAAAALSGIGDAGAAGAEEADREAVQDLTARIETALRAVTLNYDSWRQAELLDCAAQVYSRGSVEAPRRARQSEHFALKKVFLEGFRRLEEVVPDRVRGVLEATELYEGQLRRMGLEDRHVAATYPRSLVVRFVARHLWNLILWRPLALIGALFNWLPYKIPAWVTRRMTLEPDVRATWKVLLSLVLFPLFWIFAGLLIGLRFGSWWGLATLVVAPLTGYLALTYSEAWTVWREESAAFLTRRGRRAGVEELVERRGRVHDEVTRLIRLYEERFGPGAVDSSL